MRAWIVRLGIVVAAAGGLAAGGPGQLRFTGRSDLVVLHVAVSDRRGRNVPGLGRDAFTVVEDGAAQPITMFSGDDTPATIGLLIDDSTSMIALRPQVLSAVGAFLSASDAGDDLFALTFNERVRPVLPPDLPSTNKPAVLQYALQQAITARGRTALYDAVLRGLDEMASTAGPRTALVVVSDGGDNASQHVRDDVTRALARSNTVIHAVALPNPVDGDARAGELRRLADVSGGLCFVPRDPARIADAMVAIAHAIRHTYTVAYAVPAGPPGVRHVRVDVREGGDRLQARARREYVVR